MADSLDLLNSISGLVSTPSTKKRIQIFRSQIPAIFENSEAYKEFALQLVDVINSTLFIYDDRGSRDAVDNVITKALNELTFMKSFAAALVQSMEKQSKFHTRLGCHRLLKWSCLLLIYSQFSTISKNAFSRLASAQTNVIHILMEGSFRERRACKQTFFHLLSQSADICRMYIDELNDARIPYKDTPELLCLLLEFSNTLPPLFDNFKPTFLDLYVRSVLNAREKPTKDLSEAFCPLFGHMLHDDFQRIVVPSSVKMLKRNPEIVLDSVAFCLQSVTLDLSKYAVEILSVVSPQARHTDENRRIGALAIVRCLSQKSSNPDTLEAMFNNVKAVIGGSEGRLAFTYQRIGMFNMVQELAHAPEGKRIYSLSQLVCSFLLSCYRDEGNEEVKLAILSAIAAWAARSSDSIQPELLSLFASGLKEKETLRRGHLRCLRVISKNSDVVAQISGLLVPLIQLVKTGFTKAVQRLDGIYALLLVGKIAAVDIKAEEIVAKEKIWSLVSQNEPSIVPVSMVSKLSIEDCIACLDLFEVLLVEHSRRVLDTFSVRLLSQPLLFFSFHPSWDVRRMACSAIGKLIAGAPELSEALLIEFANFLSIVGEKLHLSKISDTENSLDSQVPYLPSTEVLVKSLFVISKAATTTASRDSSLIMLCSHHPRLVGTARQDNIWKRVNKCLQAHGLSVIDIISTDMENLCKGQLRILTIFCGAASCSVVMESFFGGVGGLSSVS